MKRIITLLLTLMLLLLAAGCGDQNNSSADDTPDYQPGVTGTEKGDTIADFTLTTYDGKTLVLSDILAEKDLVIINIWATWCEPCKSELPLLQEAYGKYKDRVEVLALSGDAADTDEMIGKMASDLKLTFPMARDGGAFASAFGISGFPTTIAIDRFGTICLIENSAQTSAEMFIRLFEAFLGEDYTKSVVFDAIPPMKPTAPAFTGQELSEALRGDGTALVFENDSDPYNWCMEVAERAGLTLLTSTNKGRSDSRSAVVANVNAKAGDALVIRFYLSSEAMNDLMLLQVDGKTVKVFGGDRKWITYAYAFASDGEHTIRLAYEKNSSIDGGDDTLWLDSAYLLTGEAAAAALAENPNYTFADRNSITVLNEDAREFIPEDPYDVLTHNFGYIPDCYIVPGGVARIALSLREGIDPETAFCFDNSEMLSKPLSTLFEDGQFVTSAATTGNDWSGFWYYPEGANGEMQVILFFPDETSADAFITKTVGGTWGYADELSRYLLRFVDQNGEPMRGVIFEVCSKDSRKIFVSDMQGLCELMLEPYAYEIRILTAPDGCTPDGGDTTIVSPEGGEIVFSFTKG